MYGEKELVLANSIDKESISSIVYMESCFWVDKIDELYDRYSLEPECYEMLPMIKSYLESVSEAYYNLDIGGCTFLDCMGDILNSKYLGFFVSQYIPIFYKCTELKFSARNESYITLEGKFDDIKLVSSEFYVSEFTISSSFAQDKESIGLSFDKETGYPKLTIDSNRNRYYPESWMSKSKFDCDDLELFDILLYKYKRMLLASK